MEFTCFQNMPLDVTALMEDRNADSSVLGLSQQIMYNSNPHLPGLCWSTTDPTALVSTDQPWFNRAKAPCSSIGVDGFSTNFQQQPVTSQLNLPMMDIMTTSTFFADPFSFGDGDVGATTPQSQQWMQMCSLLSDQYYNEAAMPQLVSETTAPRPCMYSASSSDGLHDADSSGSSDKGLSSGSTINCVSPEEISCWRTVRGCNLGASPQGFSSPPESSADILADPDLCEFGLVTTRQHRNAAIENAIGPVSWISATDADHGSSTAMATSVVNHPATLDPLQHSAGLVPPPYKRQRGNWYTLENIPPACGTRPVPRQPSIQTRRPDYPMALLNGADNFYKDFRFGSNRQLVPPPLAAVDALGSFGTRRSRDLIFDQDQTTTVSAIQRKPNVTSIEPQSVAARHRRKKISERVRILEKLIPGGNKMDTASMLDEAIEYVKFLQLQVQLLESLGETSSDAVGSVSLYHKDAADHGAKDRFELAQRIAGCFGSSLVSQPCSTAASQQVSLTRPALTSSTSPLILSEILQAQLFKQKLCLVSLRQYSQIP